MIRLQHSLLVSMLLIKACAHAPTRADGPQPTIASGEAMVSDRLFFGRNIPEGGMVSDSAWSAFLNDVVTPRFPAGLTVYRGEGQWTDPRGNLVRENTMIIELEHRPGAAADSMIALIADAYRTRFHQDAVLRITAPVQMRFYTATEK